MPHHHEELTVAYGFGLFPVPAYRPASRQQWHIRTHMPALGDGYLGTVAVESRAVLTRGREVWMSTGLLERESHAWHVDCARGVVVTAGLGMGMYAYAAAMKDSVDLVIAAEVSPDIIALTRQASGFDEWPCRHKVKIIETDAVGDDFAARVAECSGGRPVDYLYADIWPNFPASQAPAQTARMARALNARAAGWWGQELSFAEHTPRNGDHVTEEDLRAYFASTGVPAPRITAGYAAFCRDAMVAKGAGATPPLLRHFANALRRIGSP